MSVPCAISFRRRNIAWRQLVAIAVLLTTPFVAASQEIGAAQKVVRDVWGGGLAWRVQPQQKLRFREQINVGKESGLDVRLADGTSLSVGENAEIRLDEFVYNPASNIVNGTINFTKGAMRFVGSKAQKNVKIELPVGTVGVRGTSFNLLVDRARFEIEVVSGAVEIDSGGTLRDLVAGESAAADSGTIQLSPPSAAFRRAMTQINNALGPPTTISDGLIEVRNSAGRLTGFLVTRPDGRIDALDAQRNLLGWFDPRSDTTFVADGRRLSAGNRTPGLARGER